MMFLFYTKYKTIKKIKKRNTNITTYEELLVRKYLEVFIHVYMYNIIQLTNKLIVYNVQNEWASLHPGVKLERLAQYKNTLKMRSRGVFCVCVCVLWLGHRDYQDTSIIPSSISSWLLLARSYIKILIWENRMHLSIVYNCGFDRVSLKIAQLYIQLYRRY